MPDEDFRVRKYKACYDWVLESVVEIFEISLLLFNFRVDKSECTKNYEKNAFE